MVTNSVTNSNTQLNMISNTHSWIKDLNTARLINDLSTKFNTD